MESSINAKAYARCTAKQRTLRSCMGSYRATTILEMPVAPRILIVSGSARPDGRAATVMEFLRATAADANAEVRLHDLSTLRLPLMEQDSTTQPELHPVQQVRRDAQWAQGFILLTPEYHGSMSGSLKNWFDFLYLELAGKFAGLITVTGGGGGDMSLNALRNCFNWCHGFTLPFVAAARPPDFTNGRLDSEILRDRLIRIVHDVCRYAPLVSTAFEDARTRGPQPDAGVAGLHPLPSLAPKP